MNDKEVEKVDPDQLEAAKARHPAGKGGRRPVLRLVTKAEALANLRGLNPNDPTTWDALMNEVAENEGKS